MGDCQIIYSSIYVYECVCVATLCYNVKNESMGIEMQGLQAFTLK